jgi:hypothetical protein
MLISIQVLVIVLDAGLTSFEFLKWITLKCTIHPFVYSVKLKMEFIVLNQLLSIVKHGLVPTVDRDVIFDGNNQTRSNHRRGSSAQAVAVSPTTTQPINSKRASDTSTEVMGLGINGNSDTITITQELSVRSSNIPSESGSSDYMVDEHNLRDVVGSPDETTESTDISPQEKQMDETERMYLGRFSA